MIGIFYCTWMAESMWLVGEEHQEGREIRTTGEEFNITTATAVSIDETWSVLRFRPIDRVGK
jgi:hypothetical protein